MSIFNKLQKKAQDEGDREYKKRMAKYTPLAKRIIRLIADNLDTLELGDVKSQRPASYADLNREIMKMFMEEDVKFVDRQWVFQIVKQAFDFTQNSTLEISEKVFEAARNKLWGKEHQEISFQDIDDVLQNKK